MGDDPRDQGSGPLALRIDVRDGCERDVDALIALDDIARVDPRRAASIRDAVAGGGCLVAVHDRRFVGYGVLERSFFGHGFVSMLYVAAPFRRHGAGLALLRAFERRCPTEKLFTSTNASNEPMQALLLRAGFDPSGVVHNLDPGDPELIFVRFVRAGAG